MRKNYVVNIRSKLPYDVYVGRPSVYGNPFIIGRDGTRDEVVEKYRSYLLSRPLLVERVKRELAGKRLGCYCYPLNCHATVLAGVANE